MKIKGFSKQYKDHKVECKDIESSKRIIIIKGENGSGKSTILKAINQLITYSGTICSKGTKSYMNEQIRFPRDMTINELICSINYMDKCSKERIDYLIDHFELNDKINEPIKFLSKGMKMKLQLICAFLIERDVYCLDEPFSGLDAVSILKLISYINESDKRFIITTHIMVDFNDNFEVIEV